MKINIIIKIINEYGISWCFYRILYLLKIKFLNINKNSWKFFERKTDIKNLNIFDIDIKSLEKFLGNLEIKYKNEIIDRANKAVNGKIYAFSKNILDYGNPMKWNFNPITQKETNKNKMWFEIPDFNNEIGDIKLIWEPSRFCHLYLFSRAYIISKDIKYYKAFSEQIKQWNINNKYPYGANYKCGQESAIRMINILMNYTVFKNYNLISEEDTINVQEIVKGSYRKLLSNFFYAEKCVKNNHTISELIGLIIGAWCENNNKRIKKYYNKLVKQLEIQFKEDGGYIQYSFNYQRLVFQLLEILFKIENKINVRIENKMKQLIYKSVIQLYQLQSSNGNLPNYGSNDGALIVPVTCADYRDFSSTIRHIICFYKKQKAI